MSRLHYNLPMLVEKMFPEVAWLDAPEVALITAVRSLARVSHHVRPQCRGLSEGLATVRTGIPGTLMDSHVGRQIGLGGRFVITVRAVVVLHFLVHCLHVSAMGTSAVEVLLAQLTLIVLIIVHGVNVKS